MKIDILMATYNGEKYLEEQIISILNQSYSDFRLLISDDCSIDSTREILNKFAEKDNRIIIFFQEKNIGAVKNFEFLMGKVESEFFMFSDQDDVWKKDKIKNSIEIAEEKECDLVYSDLEVVDQNLKTLNKSYWGLKGFSGKVKYSNFESLYLNNYITGSTMLVRSKWLEKILPLPSKSKYVLHDYWTALMVSKFGKLSYLKEPQVLYRQHEENEIGSRRKSDEINDFNEMRALFIDVKIEHFSIFSKMQSRFEDELLNKLNSEALEYYKKLKNGEKISINEKKLFWKLYKYENLIYAFENYLILNKPSIAKSAYKFLK